MRCLVFAIAMSLGLVLLGCNRPAKNPDYIAGIDDGMPFGKIEDTDADALMAFAKETGVDLEKQFERAYKKDAEALGAVFDFAMKFESLDKNARVYGQAIWSSLLNLGETMGVDKYAQVLATRDPKVQQRIRDILYYPVVHLPKLMSERQAGEEGARKDYPKLFPSDFEFGHDDPVFR